MEQTTKQWKRPQDIETFRTSDPKQMLDKYLPHNVLKTWAEDFRDEDTGEIISIERHEVVVYRGLITQEKLQEIMFAIQAGDVTDVEVCDDDIQDMTLYTPKYQTNYSVVIPYFDGVTIKKLHYVVRAQTIPQALIIAAEFGQVNRGLNGNLKPSRCVELDARIVPDDHPCIPESERQEPGGRNDYFRVTVRREWVDDGKLKHSDTNYIIGASDVGTAKERTARLLDIMRAEAEKEGREPDHETHETIRKAVPFEVDCIVPREFSDLYEQEPTKL